MTLYVAIDVGCIECGEDSAVLGVFTQREQAEAAIKKGREVQLKHWGGQHLFEVHEVPDLDVVVPVGYEGALDRSGVGTVVRGRS